MSKKILSIFVFVLFIFVLTSCNTLLNKTTSSLGTSSTTSIPTQPTINTTTDNKETTSKVPSTTTNSTLDTTTDVTKTIVTTKPTITVTTTTQTTTAKKVFTYKIYYNDSLLDEFEANEGDVVNLVAPSLDGYTFNGFYLDKELTVKLEASFTANESLEIYVSFTLNEPVKYEVSFIVNNENYLQYNVIENELLDIPTNPTLDGYDFVGWYTDSNYTTLFDFQTKITGNTTLYAKFTEKQPTTCLVTFIVNSSEYKKVTVNYNTTVSKPENPTLENHEFAGWYTDSSYTTLFNFSSNILVSTTIYAKFNIIDVSSTEISVTSYGGYLEGAYVEFNTLLNLNNSTDYSIYYMGQSDASYTKIDNELVRLNNGSIRADIVGLSAGSYSIKIVAANNVTKIINDIKVSKYDRSGYAHFNYTSGVGAYTDSGNLKDGTIVVYVTEENKNTVSATINGSTYTGLINILKAQSKSKVPLNIRIIGTVGAATWNEISYDGDPLSKGLIKKKDGNILTASLSESEIISEGINTLNTSVYSKLNGLTNKLKYSSSEYDSYWNMADISNASNVTIEGIGEDAMIFQWGFTWKKCSSIEIKNLIFDDYTEDACSFEGDSSNITAYGRYWVHNNTFNQGKNYWDVCSEQDKHYGDGGMDLKCLKGATSAYNIFYKCKKTGLIGGSDSVLTMDVTFHHNYYNEVGSRLPLGRQANMHIYNNYYYKCGTCQDIRANAFVLSEANYFESCTTAQKVTINDTYKYTVIKSYNDYINGGSSSATVVNSRTQTLTGACKPDGSTDYTNFDIDSNKFYYDSVNKKSDVYILTDTMDVKDFVKKSAGAMTSGFIPTYGDVELNDSNSNNNNNDDNGSTDSGNTNPDTTLSSVLISFDSISATSYSSNITLENATIYATSAKQVTVASQKNALTVNNTSINSYLGLGGGGAITHRNISFTTTKAAKITVYYAGGSGRYLALYDSNFNEIERATATVDTSTILSYTYSSVSADSYFIASTGSGINVYCILIEYTE